MTSKTMTNFGSPKKMSKPQAPKMAMMPAQPTQDTGSGAASMGAVPMSTPTPPSVGGSPGSGAPSLAPFRGTSNAENALPSHAFHSGRGMSK